MISYSPEAYTEGGARWFTSTVYQAITQIYNSSMSIKNFHDFYFGLDRKARLDYVGRVGTTEGYMERVAGGFVLPSLRMAVRLARASRGKTSVEAIVKTYEAKNGAIA